MGFPRRDGGEHLTVVTTGPFGGEGEYDTRPRLDVAHDPSVIEQVFKVILDLIGDADSLAVSPQGIGHLVRSAGSDRGQLQCHVERGRCLEPEDLEHLSARELRRAPAPGEFSPLPLAEKALCGRRLADGQSDEIGIEPRLGQQSVALADQEIADVECDRHAMCSAERGLTIAFKIAVLDVVVDE